MIAAFVSIAIVFTVVWTALWIAAFRQSRRTRIPLSFIPEIGSRSDEDGEDAA